MLNTAAPDFGQDVQTQHRPNNYCRELGVALAVCQQAGGRAVGDRGELARRVAFPGVVYDRGVRGSCYECRGADAEGRGMSERKS